MYNKIFVFVLFTCAYGASLPSYIKPCRRADPDFNKCAKLHAKEAIPRILKGDRKFKVPVLSPFKLPEVSLQANPNLKIKLSDITINGIETAQLKDINFDFENKQIIAKIDIDHLVVIGQYEIDGRLLVPLRGNGPCNITLTGVTVQYEFTYETETKKNQQYIKLLSDNLEFTAVRTHYHLDNLFNDQRISDETNKILNENFRDVGGELNRPVAETIRQVVTEILKKYLTIVPIEEIFL